MAANDATKITGAVDPTLTYSLASGSLVAGDSLSVAVSRMPGELPGGYVINQGSLVAWPNYLVSFSPGVFCIDPPPVTSLAAAPANGQSSNAANGASAFAVANTLGESPGAAGGGSGIGALGLTLEPSSSSGAPYPDNQWVSDPIRFGQSGGH